MHWSFAVCKRALNTNTHILFAKRKRGLNTRQGKERNEGITSNNKINRNNSDRGMCVWEWVHVFFFSYILFWLKCVNFCKRVCLFVCILHLLLDSFHFICALAIISCVSSLRVFSLCGVIVESLLCGFAQCVQFSTRNCANGSNMARNEEQECLYENERETEIERGGNEYKPSRRFICNKRRREERKTHTHTQQEQANDVICYLFFVMCDVFWLLPLQFFFYLLPFDFVLMRVYNQNGIKYTLKDNKRTFRLLYRWFTRMKKGGREI